MPTFKTEALWLVTYLTTAVLNNYYNKVTGYTAPAYSYEASFSLQV